ncbi:T9SS type A sorting domain-containing protein [Flavobacteriaceae bacterium GSB9]|nr:T9SS type A sorting domain-containing protein [Flavobacteriaceae bacterium GSB9]
MKQQNLRLFLFIILGIVLPIQLNAQAKQVLYVNQTGVGASSSLPSDPGEDFVIKMLQEDPNFDVTYIETSQDGSDLPEITGFDLIIAQENIVSGADLFKPNGLLGIKNVTVPIIYNKSGAFRDGKAVTDVDAVAESTQNLFITVPQANQDHDIFSGINFSGGEQIRIHYELSNGDGSELGNNSIEIINYLDISDPNTLLATVPEIINPEKAMAINYFPAGTQLGENPDDQLLVDAVALPFKYGALVRNDGKNISSEALTIWRNAAYLLTGLVVPEELYYNPETAMNVLYVNQTGVDPGDGGGSAPGYDPVVRMLEFDQHFTVTYVETPADGSAIPNDLTEFDLIVAQETISSDAGLFTPEGPLGVKNVSVPIIYNKTWAFTDGKAVTDADAVVSATQNFFITVPEANQGHDIFSGIDFSGGDQVRITYELANDDGSPGGNKAIDVLNDLEISTPNTLLATVNEVTDPQKAFVVNYLPAGTQLGEAATDQLQVDAVALSFSYGALVKGKGTNITAEALTIWRNAAYMLTNVPIPNELYDNPALHKQVLYLNQKGVDAPTPEVSTPGDDPIIRMLEADGNFEVTYIETYNHGLQIIDPGFFDLVIAQETLSSGGDFFKPGGKLGVRDIQTPIIYNKSSTFRDSRAVTDANAINVDTQNLSVTVLPENQNHDLFSGIDFNSSNQIRLLAETSQSDGTDGGNKAIEIINELDISTSGSLLATVDEVSVADKAVVFNFWPEGTQLGENLNDVLNVDAFAFSLSYGAIVNGDGENISSEALTMWRNAAYILTGLEVPTDLYVNPDYTLSIDKAGQVSKVSSSVRAIGNRIYVSDVKLPTEINIYSISGALVKTVITYTNTNFNFNTGLWIATVKTIEGTKAVKLLVM